MKKTILILFTIILIFVTIISVKYSSYKNEYNNILKENSEYEEYTKKEIYGIELATLINKTIDKNTKNKNKENYNSVEIDIYMQDNEQTYNMEIFYKAGIEQFVQYYGNILFKCSKIEYNKNTKRVEYLVFEQVVTS